MVGLLSLRCASSLVRFSCGAQVKVKLLGMRLKDFTTRVIKNIVLVGLIN